MSVLQIKYTLGEQLKRVILGVIQTLHYNLQSNSSNFINSLSFFLRLEQGHCKSWRTQQYITINIEHRVHGSSHTHNTATPTTTIGTRKSGCVGGSSQRCQPRHFRMSTPISQSKMELFDEKFSTRQKSIRQNR